MLDQAPLISVIVPIYNVECYLNECIESIIRQTYNSFEIILIDDGSTDMSTAICDNWARKDSRVIVIHQMNQGAPAARNTGLRNAKGDYIAFVDADDYIDEKMFEIMVKEMLEKQADIVVCGVNWVKENGDRIREESNTAYFENKSIAMRDLLGKTSIKEQVWDKLYKKEIVEDVSFIEGKKIDDVFWTYRVIGRAKRISVINQALYFYVQRQSSVMGVGYKSYWVQTLEACQLRCEYIKDNMPDIYNFSIINYLGVCMYHLQKAMQTKQDVQTIDCILQNIEYIKQQETDFSCVSLKQRLWLKCFINMPGITTTIRNYLNIGT